MPEIPDVNPGETIESGSFGNPVIARVISRYTNDGDRATKNPTPAQGDPAYMLDNDRLLLNDAGGSWQPAKPGSRILIGTASGTVTQLGVWETIATGSFTLPGAPTLAGVRTSVWYCAMGFTDTTPQNDNLNRLRIRLNTGAGFTNGQEVRNTADTRYQPIMAMHGVANVLATAVLSWEVQAQQASGSPGDTSWSLNTVAIADHEGWL